MEVIELKPYAKVSVIEPLVAVVRVEFVEPQLVDHSNVVGVDYFLKHSSFEFIYNFKMTKELFFI